MVLVVVSAALYILVIPLPDISGLRRKEDGKPCMTSVTITLFQITLRRISPSFKLIFS